MLRLLKLFRPKSPSFTDELRQAITPKTDAERIALALYAMLSKQFELMDFEISKVPAVEPFTSKKCRGALFGIAAGVLAAEGIPADQQNMTDAAITTFVLTFGDDLGRVEYDRTVGDIRHEDNDVLSAAEWAAKDAEGVYTSGDVNSCSAFYLAAQGLI